jgi:chaperonin GroES
MTYTAELTTVRCLHDTVLVQKTPEGTTKGGIVIPQSAHDTTAIGTVIDMGPGAQIASGGTVVTVPTNLDKGDRVLFSPHAGREIKVDGDTFIAMKAIEIFAVVNDEHQFTS